MYEKPEFVVCHGETARGFRDIEFLDRNDQPCSVQESSLAGEACIWLGRDHNTEPTRMHLDKKQVAWLIAVLAEWMTDGVLP